MKFKRFVVINLIDHKVTEFKIKCFTKNPFQEFLKFLFGKYEFIDCQERFHQDVGHPDFIVRNNIGDLYVEYKSLNDRIHTSQIKWIFNNKNKKTIIVHQIDK